MARKPPRWYFSFRSPYSWFAFLDLVGRYPHVADGIEWIPYWEPDECTSRLLHAAGARVSYAPMSREKHFYILQDARRLARGRGLSMTWPLDREPTWEVAHLGWFAARDHGLGREYVAAVYRARWELGLDISDRGTIAGIAAELGLDEDLLTGVTDDPQVRALGAQALARADKDGVFGVPFLVHGREKFWGVERLAAFADAVTGQAGADPVAPALPEPVPVPAADGGHAGGCG